jgi:hypothetical protein
MTRSPVIRYAATMALALACALAVAAPASALTPPRFYTLMVPARDDTPQNVRVYATLGGVGNGNRLGDPVILTTRAGLNPRQEWLPIDPRYPNLPEEVITGGADFDCDFAPFCDFEGQSPVAGARVKLVSRYSGKCLTISGVVAHGAPITQQTCRTSDPKQSWQMTLRVKHPLSNVTPVFWYREGELRCLGPAARSAGRELTIHRRLKTTDVCPHWVVQHAVTGFWRRPFTNPF